MSGNKVKSRTKRKRTKQITIKLNKKKFEPMFEFFMQFGLSKSYSEVAAKSMIYCYDLVKRKDYRKLGKTLKGSLVEVNQRYIEVSKG